MIKALVFLLLGAAGTYLYLNPGDVAGMIELGKDSINQGASIVKDMTE